MYCLWQNWTDQTGNLNSLFNCKQDMAQIRSRQYFHIFTSDFSFWTNRASCPLELVHTWRLLLPKAVEHCAADPQWLLNHSNTKRDMCAGSYYFVHVLGILSCWNCWQSHIDGFFYIGHLVEAKPHPTESFFM